MKKYLVLLLFLASITVTSVCSARWIWISSDSEKTFSYENSFQRTYVDGTEAITIWEKEDIPGEEVNGYIIYEFAYDLQTNRYFLVHSKVTFNDTGMSEPLYVSKTGCWLDVEPNTKAEELFKIALADYNNQKSKN